DLTRLRGFEVDDEFAAEDREEEIDADGLQQPRAIEFPCNVGHDHRQPGLALSTQLPLLAEAGQLIGSLDWQRQSGVVYSGTPIPLRKVLLPVVLVDLQDGLPHEQLATVLLPNGQSEHAADLARGTVDGFS